MNVPTNLWYTQDTRLFSINQFTMHMHIIACSSLNSSKDVKYIIDVRMYFTVCGSRNFEQKVSHCL